MARIEKWDEVHGNQAPDEKMMAFLDSATDQYAILQLRCSEDTVYERFLSMRELERMLHRFFSLAGTAVKESGTPCLQKSGF